MSKLFPARSTEKRTWAYKPSEILYGIVMGAIALAVGLLILAVIVLVYMLMAAIGWIAVVVFSVAQIVKRVFRGKSKRAPDTVGDQAIETGALVHLVEVGQRFALIEDTATIGGFNRRPVGVIQQPFGEI